jgi:metal-sulfur cluster biosynthetic enzyme
MSRLVKDTWEKLKQVFDPEIPVSIVDLGLVYDVRELESNNIHITMTVTSAYCPAANFLPEQVREAAEQVPGIKDVQVDVVFSPAWSRQMISAEAKIFLGYK